MNVMNIFSVVGSKVMKYKYPIAIGLSLVGAFSTGVAIAKGNTKAKELLKEAQEKKGEEPLTKTEIVKVAAPAYAPAVITGALTLGCVVCSGKIKQADDAAILAACALSESKLKEYKEAAKEVLDEKTKKKVDEKAVEKSVENNPPVERTVIVTNTGDTLCRESWTGQYFRADIFKVQKILNELAEKENDQLRAGFESWLSAGELCDKLGIDSDMGACEATWNNMSNPFKWIASSCNAPSGEPVYVITYEYDPEYKGV